MLVSWQWLKELVELPSEVTPDVVADKLSLSGLEVEGADDVSAAFEGVVVGEVTACEAHPNSQKLKLCKVSDGSKSWSVVCGAPNVEAGIKVAFAKVGSHPPNAVAIGAREVAGEMSHGMLCSGKELGVSDDHSGIMILDGDLEAGAPIAEVLNKNDVILEIGVTPNRPDALSHLGVAREIAALFDGRLRANVPTCPERGGPVDDRATVSIEDLEGCPRYACRVIDGVSVGESPAWVKSRLESVGIRAINNVVDVTNLVMMERGIPLHAFDYAKVSVDRDRAAVIVRRAKAGERIKTLDGEDRVLVEDDLVIADPQKAIAIAGVMGGANSEVEGGTTRVLLEGAYFQSSSVRRTARRLGIHSRGEPPL